MTKPIYIRVSTLRNRLHVSSIPVREKDQARVRNDVLDVIRISPADDNFVEYLGYDGCFHPAPAEFKDLIALRRRPKYKEQRLVKAAKRYYKTGRLSVNLPCR